MKVQFIDIILFVLFFQILSLVPFLLFQKSKRSLPNKILATFLLAKALCITNFISGRLPDFFLAHFPHIFLFGSSFTILWGPALYFYTKSLTTKNFSFRKWDALHLLPFSIHFLYLTFNFHIYNADVKRQIITSGSLLTKQYYMIYIHYLHLSILIYTIAALILVWHYRQEIKNSFSSVHKRNLSWLYFVLFGFIAKWILDVLLIMKWTYHIEIGFSPLLMSRIVLFLFINIMIFKGLRQPSIFSGLEPEPIPMPRQSLSKASVDTYLKRLTSYMEHQKPFLDPELTLIELSDQVSIPPRSLSEVINLGLGQNFFDFVNSYRIKESKRLLTVPEHDKKTVLEILYEVGFNSKSSFNKAFKKYTGMTPSRFKQLQRA